MPLLTVENLSVGLVTDRGYLRPVRQLSYSLAEGETLAVVGESGSGKTVSQLALLGLLPEKMLRIESGSAHFEGRDLLALPPEELRKIRGSKIAYVFQEPLTALNPFLTLGSQIEEPLILHTQLSPKERELRVQEALERVYLPAGRRVLRAYPHELSGGMRQRAVLAMALVNRPRLLIADEPTTALDVTVQAQILQLLKELQKDLGMGILLITHDLGVVATIAHRVLVMYAGMAVEEASVATLFQKAHHPYSQLLWKAIPGEKGERLSAISGQPPDLRNTSPLCPFLERCPVAVPECQKVPPPFPTFSPQHRSRCHLPGGT